MLRKRFKHIKKVLQATPIIALIILFSASFNVAANNPTIADVVYNDGIYSSTLSTTIHAPRKSIYQLLTSYNDLSKYSRLIYKSQLLANGHLLLNLKVCFFVICFDKKLTLSLEISNHSINGRIVPEYSDFKSGSLKWHLSGNNLASFLQFSGELTPNFWLPPIIGPLLIKHKLRSEAKYSVKQLKLLSTLNTNVQ
ncbi:MAG: hypothetical protein KUG50_01010 [Cycloclasticus sp.]|nr:hypothetical protein [Cycloclasticus sp.]